MVGTMYRVQDLALTEDAEGRVDMDIKTRNLGFYT